MVTKSGGIARQDEVLREAATIRDTITMMVRFGRPCAVTLKRGLRFTINPERWFSISRAGDVPPSAVEVRVVCDKSQDSALPLRELDAQPGERGAGRSYVWWSLVAIPIEELNDDGRQGNDTKHGQAGATFGAMRSANQDKGERRQKVGKPAIERAAFVLDC